MPEHLTLKEAAEELGVHYMTVYRYVRLGLLPATRDTSGWLIERRDFEALTTPSRSGPARNRHTPWDRRIEARLVAGDEAGAWKVIEAALAAGATPSGIYTDVLSPAMRRIGDRWARGELDVADEHRATAIAYRLVGRLGPRFARPGRTRGSVVVTTPPGERHGLGASMLADLLRGAHYRVIDLGTDVPLESLVRTVEETDDLVAVCVSAFTRGRDEVVAATLAAAGGAGARVLVGGTAIRDREHSLALGAAGWAPDAPTAVEVIGAF